MAARESSPVRRSIAIGVEIGLLYGAYEAWSGMPTEFGSLSRNGALVLLFTHTAVNLALGAMAGLMAGSVIGLAIKQWRKNQAAAGRGDIGSSPPPAVDTRAAGSDVAGPA